MFNLYGIQLRYSDKPEKIEITGIIRKPVVVQVIVECFTVCFIPMKSHSSQFINMMKTPLKTTPLGRPTSSVQQFMLVRKNGLN